MLTVVIAKLDETRTLDETALPRESLVYLLNYGLTQAMNDVHSAVARKNFESDEAFVEAVRVKADKRWEQIMSGNVPGTRAPADPKAAEGRRIAKTYTPDELAEMEAFISKKREKAARHAA